MPESDIETEFVSHVHAQGGLAFKFTSPGLRGVPDRLALFPAKFAVDTLVHLYGIPEDEAKVMVRAVREASIRFVELKDIGKAPRQNQQEIAKKLAARGFDVIHAASNPEARMAANPLARVKS